MTLAEYQTIVRAIVAQAKKMGQDDERTVLACLWEAGVHPSDFRPTWKDAMGVAEEPDADPTGAQLDAQLTGGY